MALAYSTDFPLGTKAPEFNLKGVDGSFYSLSGFRNAQGLLIIFICNHCPYVKATIQRFIAIQKDFASRGIQLVGISSNNAVKYPEDSFENMKKFSEEQGFNFPYLYDETQEVAKAYDAVCTPDIYLFNSNKKLVYHGRLDDNWEYPEKVQENSLRKAIDEYLSNGKITGEQFPAMGCSIKWK